MKQHIFPAIKLTLACLVFFSGIYTLLILGIARFAPNRGEGEIIQKNGITVGYALEAQNFSGDGYFASRPSATGYNAAGSAGSNKGPTNPDYLKDVQNRIDTFLVHNKTIPRDQITSELVTSSGSGLDPHISPSGAYIQVPRIARARGYREEKINFLVSQFIEPPLLGLFGTERINVLKLNIALDNLK